MTLSRTDPFYSSKFSLEWAQHHLTELDREMEQLFTEHDQTPVVEPDAEGVFNLVKFKLTKPFPISITGRVIDIANNLRSALDQAIYSIANISSGLIPYENPAFTIGDSSDYKRFEPRFNGTTAKYVPAEIATLLLGMKPYKGGNDLLWALNKLSNTHKHAVILPFPLANCAFSAAGTHVSGESIQIPVKRVWDHEKNEMILARIPVNSEFDVNIQIAFVIAFGEIPGVENKEIASTLYAFFDETQSVITDLESKCREIGLI